MRNLAKALVLLVLMAGLVSQSALASDNTIWDYLKEIDLSKDNEKVLSDYIEYKNEFLEEKKTVPDEIIQGWVFILEWYASSFKSELSYRETSGTVIPLYEYPSADLKLADIRIVSIEVRKAESNKEYLVVGYNWTNKTDSEMPFILLFTPESYKSGVKLDEATIQNFDTKSVTMVSPGDSCTSYCIYPITDLEPIDLNVQLISDPLAQYGSLTYTVTFEQTE